jgi:hypothetical protein
MRPPWARLVRRVAVSGIFLGVIGYLLARAFLFTHRLYGGGAYIEENERVLWQTPAVMAGLGMALTAGMDLLLALVRRPMPTSAPAPETPPST